MKDANKLLGRITVDAEVLAGKPIIRGLRISVEQILTAMAAGVPNEDLLHDYPEQEPEDLRAALLYAAARISDEEVYPAEVGCFPGEILGAGCESLPASNTARAYSSSYAFDSNQG